MKQRLVVLIHGKRIIHKGVTGHSHSEHLEAIDPKEVIHIGAVGILSSSEMDCKTCAFNSSKLSAGDEAAPSSTDSDKRLDSGSRCS